ncbi:MAG: hypothetical protein ACU0C9_03480 [Paracoccaceae bacterium]
MTALNKFERLECQGIWRAAEGAQRRDVIVAVGEATLTLSDQQDIAIVHWSLPAIERVNPGQRPAKFRPGPDASDILELTDDIMIRAIAKVHTAIERRRPHPGRLRLGLFSGIAVFLVALAVFWLPGAMVNYTASVVPASKRVSIGESLLVNIRRIAGKQCDAVLGQQSLRALQIRLFDQAPGKIVILAGGVQLAQHLPGDIIILNRALVEDYEEVDVVAGFLIVERLRAQKYDPLANLLHSVRFSALFQLLTTGDIPESVLGAYAETLMTSEPEYVSEKEILTQFENAAVRTTPYAYAIDISGESTLGLIEADPGAGQEFRPIADDGDWISLQGICGE